MRPDHRHVRAKGLHRERDAGEQTTATGAHHDGADLGQVMEDLQSESALASHDVGVVERVDDDGAGLLCERLRRGDRLVDGGTREVDIGAIRSGRGDLRDARALGHEDRGRNPEQLRGKSDTLRMIARGRCDHTPLLRLIAKAGNAGVGATDLERSRSLEVLRCEEDRPTHSIGEPAG